MRAFGRLLTLGVAAFLVAQLLLGRSHRYSGTGQEAPALALPDLGGRKVNLSALRGRVVAVNFWATWCLPCRLEIQELAAFWRENHQACFEMLGIAEESGTPAEVAQATDSLGIPYPVLWDGDGSVAERYRVPGYPRTYIIDVTGKVRRVFDGAIRRQDLEAAVRPLLSEPDTTCPRA